MNNNTPPLTTGNAGKSGSQTADDYLTPSALDGVLLGMVGLVLFGILLWFVTSP